MFHILIFCVVLLSVTTDIVQSRCVKDDWQMPVGITLHKVVRTWDKAHLHCKNEGAVIASPIDSKMLNAMKSLIAVKNTFYFIGTRTYNNNSGEYISIEGVPLHCMTTAVVSMIESLDPYDGDCLCMDQNSIRAVPCSIRLPFMCYKSQTEYNVTPMTEDNIMTTEVQDLLSTERIEQETVTDMTKQEPTTEVKEYRSLSTNCGPGYTFNASTAKCYKLHCQEMYMTWDMIEATCVSEGAHLVVIDDRTELEVIADMTTACIHIVYIGLRYHANDGWKSIHGTPVEQLFNEWTSDQHLTKPYIECAGINHVGQMDNFGCDYILGYICEKSPIFE